MSTIFQIWPTSARAFNKLRNSFVLPSRWGYRAYSKIKVDDIVLLEKQDSSTAKPLLTIPLQPHGNVKAAHGDSIDCDGLIGREPRDRVYSRKGVAYRVQQPSLAEYVTLSPRIVTPVYPADANLIVSLLDIHPQIDPGDYINEPLEIFEAGTGHGALTLYLARAIHGLNPPPPPLPPRKPDQKRQINIPKPEDPDINNADKAIVLIDEPPMGDLASESSNIFSPDRARVVLNESSQSEPHPDNPESLSSDQATQLIDNVNKGPNSKSEEEARYEAYLASRRAVIHTLDISPFHSNFARKVVRNFRRGIYYHNIDFHVGTIPEYLLSRSASTHTPFLDYAILDLPTPQEYLRILGQALKPNGCLIVFCPSITQIADCVKTVKETKLPFFQESILELGQGIGVGGREWDVRVVKTRARARAEAEMGRVDGKKEAVLESDSADGQGELSMESNSKESDWVTVCRPKVGDRVAGGGFLGLWRRIKLSPKPNTGPTPTQEKEVKQAVSNPKDVSNI